MTWRRQCRYCDQRVRSRRAVTCEGCLGRLKTDTHAAKMAALGKRAADAAPCACVDGWVSVDVRERHPPYRWTIKMPCARHEPTTETPSQP
jgi:hypothetical protein